MLYKSVCIEQLYKHIYIYSVWDEICIVLFFQSLEALHVRQQKSSTCSLHPRGWWRFRKIDFWQFLYVSI